MRFSEIREFDVDELYLDEQNYRFSKAVDQQQCIKKIHDSNPAYFRGLMKSVAEDDIGEVILVYQSNGDNIVADGNRRLSALKVLCDDKYAPSISIRELAKELRSKYSINSSQIQAQVSDDKKLISRTVYERHSSGKTGTSRIPWSAYAAARFGYDEKIGEDNDWRIIALLAEAEQKQTWISVFLDSGEFSFEVFRRLVRSALKLGRISNNIFSERGERIKGNARKVLVNDAIEKVRSFLRLMKDGGISLSRKGEAIYADAAAVDSLIESYIKSPDELELDLAKEAGSEKPTSTERSQSTKTGNREEKEETPQQNGDGPYDNGSVEESEEPSEQDNATKTTAIGIAKSDVLSQKLRELDNEKLVSLYYSLCNVSLRRHPALMYVGAWSFLEVLSKACGNTNSEFPGYFNQKLHSYGIAKQERKDCKRVMDDISKYGNAIKHSKIATQVSAQQLRHDFKVLEDMLIAALESAISSN